MSLFEAGFNLPPGCSPGDPRAPWNQDYPRGVEDVMGTTAGVPAEEGSWTVGRSRVRLPSGSLGVIMTDHLDETYTVQLHEGHPVHVSGRSLVEIGDVTDYEELEPDVEEDEDGRARAYGGGIRYEVTLGDGRRVWLHEGDLR